MAARFSFQGRWTRRAACAAVLLGLSACGGGKAPEVSYYRLTAGDIPKRAGGPLPGVVDVPALRAAGMLNDRAILYSNGAASVAAYNYNVWWASPGTMLQNSLIDALRRAQAFQVVTTPELRLDRDYEISGRIGRFEQDGTTVKVEIELMLRLPRSGTPVLLKTYSQEVPAADQSVPAAVAAFSTAVNQIWAQFVTDLAAVTPPPAT